MPDLASNLFQEDVGQPCSQQLMADELVGTSGVSGAELDDQGDSIVLDNVAGDNQTQEYCTENISTTAEDPYGIG